MGGEQVAGPRIGQHAVVHTDDHIGGTVLAFQLQPVEDGDPVFQRHEFQITAAAGLEGLLDLGPRAPVGGKGSYNFV